VILVICALMPELRHFEPRDGVELFACGVGPVEAAAETARKLAERRYEAVINAGIGGAFRGGCVELGDVVAITGERLADLGLEGGGRLSLPGGATLVEHTSADAAIVEQLRDGRLPLGRGVTVAQVTTTDATARRLYERYGADVESMEGFSVLRAAALAHVPAIEVRGISNYVGDRAASEWDFSAGARAAVAGLDAVLDRLIERRMDRL
jgi:futalosine hydrolase